MSKLKDSLELIKLLRIDVYMALFMFGYGLAQVPHVEFIQDKVCLNELHQDEISCGTLTTGSTETAELQSTVLSITSSIVNYQTLASTIPGVIQSFFFGYWIDKYPSHLKYLLVLPSIGLLIQSGIMIYQCIYFDVAIIYSLWAHLGFGLGGGQALALAAAFTYAAKKTPQKFRSVRFALIDLFIFTAYPIGVAVGGKILAGQPWFMKEKRNFAAIFTSSAVTMVIAIIWALVTITDSGPSDESEESNEQPKVTNSTNGETSMTEVDLNEGGTGDDGQKAKNEKEEPKTGAWAIAADIFNFKNVYATIKTFLRDRPNNGRKKVILLVSCVLAIFVSLVSESMIGFQYTEKVFLWGYQYYSSTYAYLQLVQSLGTIVGATFLKNYIKLADLEVAAIGTLSHFLGNLIKGIPTVACYFAGSIAFCLSGIAIPATRSAVTRLIDFNEIGQVLAMISICQALGPMVASSQTTAIFRATLDTAPGTTYHFLALTVVPPLIAQLWVGFSGDSKDEDDKKLSTKVRFEIGGGDNEEREMVNIQGLGVSEGGQKF